MNIKKIEYKENEYKNNIKRVKNDRISYTST